MRCRHCRGPGFRPSACTRPLKRAPPAPSADASVSAGASAGAESQGPASNGEKVDEDDAAFCLSCGLVLRLSDVPAHCAQSPHDVFVSLASGEVVCTKCKRTRSRSFRGGDLGVIVEVEAAQEGLVKFLRVLDDWLQAHDWRVLLAPAKPNPKLRVGASDSESMAKAKTKKRKNVRSPITAGQAGLELEPSAKLAGLEADLSRLSLTSSSLSLSLSSSSLPAGHGPHAEQHEPLAHGAPHGALHGIANIGNTCFLNSVLQCLAHSPLLYANIKAVCERAERAQLELELSSAMCDILAAVRDGFVVQYGRGAMNQRKKKNKQSQSPASRHMKATAAAETRPKVHPSRVLASIRAVAPQFAGNGQQDAHELLVELLRGLEEDEEALDAHEARGEGRDSDSDDHDEHEEEDGEEEEEAQEGKTRAKTKKKKKSYVLQLLSTEVHHQIQCLHCQSVTRRCEESVVTSFDIPDGAGGAGPPPDANLAECLSASFAAETQLLLSEDNGLECAKCSACALDKCPEAQEAQVRGDRGLDAEMPCTLPSFMNEDEEEGDGDGDVDTDGDGDVDTDGDGDVDTDGGADEESESAPGNTPGAGVEHSHKRDAVMRAVPSRAPPLLLLHIKRFRSVLDKRTGSVRGCKNKTVVTLAEQTTLAFGEARHRYALYGVVAHRGASMHRGHYVSCTRPCRTQGEGGEGGEGGVVSPGRGAWWFASDATVNPAATAKVLREEAYLAFYERIDE